MKKFFVYIYLLVVTVMFMILFVTIPFWGLFALMFKVDPQDVTESISFYVTDMLDKYQIFE